MAISPSDVQKKEFNPHEHLMQIKSGTGENEKTSDYLPVQWRLVWFRSAFPGGTIETEMIHLDLNMEFSEKKKVWNYEKRKNEWTMVTGKGIAIFRAVVKDGIGGVATGTKSEKACSFTDFIEKAETGAIGRALAALGYGTQFAPEMEEGERIVDSPVDGKPEDKEQGQKAANKQPQSMGEYPASQQQRGSIIKLCEALGKPSPLTPQTTFEQAKALIQQLTTEHKEAKKQQPAAMNNTQEITAVSLRARIAEIQPRGKDDDLATLESLYTSITNGKYPGDEALPVGVRVRLNRQLDEIVRLRQQEAQATA